MILPWFSFTSSNQKIIQIIYSQDIPSQYNVSKDIFKTLLREIRELFEKLRIAHQNNNDQVWTNHTLALDSNSQFQLDYNNVDILASELDGIKELHYGSTKLLVFCLKTRMIKNF